MWLETRAGAVICTQKRGPTCKPLRVRRESLRVRRKPLRSAPTKWRESLKYKRQDSKARRHLTSTSRYQTQKHAHIGTSQREQTCLGTIQEHLVLILYSLCLCFRAFTNLVSLLLSLRSPIALGVGEENLAPIISLPGGAGKPSGRGLRSPWWSQFLSVGVSQNRFKTGRQRLGQLCS